MVKNVSRTYSECTVGSRLSSFVSSASPMTEWLAGWRSHTSSCLGQPLLELPKGCLRVLHDSGPKTPLAQPLHLSQVLPQVLNRQRCTTRALLFRDIRILRGAELPHPSGHQGKLSNVLRERSPNLVVHLEREGHVRFGDAGSAQELSQEVPILKVPFESV